ncbi:MAG: hypothetical protein ACOC1K_03265 [Nanoarchaeota archaeon]
MLAYNHKDDRFLDKLSSQGVSYVNKYMYDKLHIENSAIINLRSLPRPSESSWIYQNINEKSYSTDYNFLRKKYNTSENTRPRLKALIRAFYKPSSPFILGTGDKHNKRAFFEKFLSIDFRKEKLYTGKEIYIANDKKIILTDYFDHRSLGLKSLKEIYNIAKDKNFI